MLSGLFGGISPQLQGSSEGRGLPNRRRRENGRRRRKSGLGTWVFSKSSCLGLYIIGARASRFPLLPATLAALMLMTDEAIGHSGCGSRMTGFVAAASVLLMMEAMREAPGLWHRGTGSREVKVCAVGIPLASPLQNSAPPEISLQL